MKGKQAKDCSHFNNCSAPLCPKDESSLLHGIWIPGEEICKIKPAPEWIKNQKHISRKQKRQDVYWIYKKLSVEKVSLVGLNIEKRKG